MSEYLDSLPKITDAWRRGERAGYLRYKLNLQDAVAIPFAIDSQDGRDFCSGLKWGEARAEQEYQDEMQRHSVPAWLVEDGGR